MQRAFEYTSDEAFIRYLGNICRNCHRRKYDLKRTLHRIESAIRGRVTMMKKLKEKQAGNSKKKEEKVTLSKAVTIVHNSDVVVKKKFSNSDIIDESLNQSEKTLH